MRTHIYTQTDRQTNQDLTSTKTIRAVVHTAALLEETKATFSPHCDTHTDVIVKVAAMLEPGGPRSSDGVIT